MFTTSSSSPVKPTTILQTSTWRLLEDGFRCDVYEHSIDFSLATRWLRPASRVALQRNFNELKLALSEAPLKQTDLPSKHVFSALHFACRALNVSHSALHSETLGLLIRVNSLVFADSPPSP
jgi:hypothetical protein